MTQVKTDLRTLRTRHFIIEAFIALAAKKDFEAISVKEITEEAMINRATFYNHFIDKYDLLEQVIAENLARKLNCEQKKTFLSLEETIQQVFVSLVSFRTSERFVLLNQKEVTDEIIRKELLRLFTEELAQKESMQDPIILKKTAQLLTHSVIGMSREWVQSNSEESPEEYITSLLPLLLNGLNTI